MSIYDRFAEKRGIKPLTSPNALKGDGQSMATRHNYLSLANGVELVTEVMMGIAAKTDAISLEIEGNKLIRDDVNASVTRSFESVIGSAVEIATNDK